MEAETSESWECNSYHPKIHSAITALHQALEAEQPAQHPLTDDQIINWVETGEYNVIANDWTSHIEFVRAIEAAHGIT